MGVKKPILLERDDQSFFPAGGKTSMRNISAKTENVKRDTLSVYQGKKLDASKIAVYFDRFDGHKAKRLRICGSYFVFEERRYEDRTERKIIEAKFCQLRLCPICSWRRSRKLYGEVMSIITQPEFVDQKFVFLTLTVKNCEKESLKDELNRITRAFNKLTKDDDSYFNLAFTGAFRAVEITYNKKTNMYHPHMHVLVSVGPDYFKKSNKHYMSHDRLMGLWREKCGLDYDPAVRIQKVMGDKSKQVAEVAKYTVKSTDMPNAAVAETLDKALHRVRLVSFCGLFKRVRNRLDEEGLENQTEGLGEASTMTAETYEIWRTLYRWKVGARVYELVWEKRSG
jgi:plasmid rolling circle replication initiator protein Rep